MQQMSGTISKSISKPHELNGKQCFKHGLQLNETGDIWFSMIRFTDEVFPVGSKVSFSYDVKNFNGRPYNNIDYKSIQVNGAPVYQKSTYSKKYSPNTQDSIAKQNALSHATALVIAKLGNTITQMSYDQISSDVISLASKFFDYTKASSTEPQQPMQQAQYHQEPKQQYPQQSYPNVSVADYSNQSNEFEDIPF